MVLSEALRSLEYKRKKKGDGGGKKKKGCFGKSMSAHGPPQKGRRHQLNKLGEQAQFIRGTADQVLGSALT